MVNPVDHARVDIDSCAILLSRGKEGEEFLVVCYFVVLIIISILFDGNFSMDVESILGTSVSNEEKFLSTK